MAVYVSASALRDFISCERKVYYRIFEPEVAVPNKEATLGIIVHEVLEKAWDSREKARKLGLQLWEKSLLDLTARESMLHFINMYFDRFAVMVRPDDKIEKRFKVKLVDDVYLVGKFDRITMGTVIDWKTDANPPKKLDNSIQFVIYNLAYALLYNKPPEGLYLAALKDGSLVRYSESKQHADAVVTQIIPDFVSAVRQKEFIKRGLFNGACYRCPYKRPCLGDENELVHPAVAQE